MPTLKPTYRFIPESSGGTYTFSDLTATQRNPWIGTTGLIFCVGVYIPISASRCFFAHISAYVERIDDPQQDRNVKGGEGDEMREQVRQRLKKNAKDNDWSVDDVRECVSSSGRRIVVICPHLNDEPNRCGKFVIKGIEDFLGPDLAGLIDCAKCDSDDKQGLVVNHRDKVVEYLEQHFGTEEGGLKERIMGVPHKKFAGCDEYPPLRRRGEWTMVLKEHWK